MEFVLIHMQAAERILQQSQSVPGMEITYYGSFSEHIVSAFDQIYSSEVKIILGLFGEEYAQSVLCMVRHNVLFCIPNIAALVQALLLQE